MPPVKSRMKLPRTERRVVRPAKHCDGSPRASVSTYDGAKHIEESGVSRADRLGLAADNNVLAGRHKQLRASACYIHRETLPFGQFACSPVSIRGVKREE